MYLGFKKLESKLSGHVDNPAAVAASIGKRKYGSHAMGKASALSRKKGHGAAAAYIKGLKG